MAGLKFTANSLISARCFTQSKKGLSLQAPLRIRGGSVSADIGDFFKGEDRIFSRRGDDKVVAIESAEEAAKPRVVFILGGPGAGKGTQCAKLTSEFRRLRHLSAGDLLRDERKSGSPQGELIEQYIREGKIVPVEITAGLLQAAILRDRDRYEVFLVDGFPRNLDNLAGWRRMVGAAAAVEFLVLLECSQEVLLTRLLRRGLTSGRSDDNEETIRKRFHSYAKETLPVVRYFESRDRLHRVDSDRPVGRVYADVRRLLRPLAQRSRGNGLFKGLHLPKLAAAGAAALVAALALLLRRS